MKATTRLHQHPDQELIRLQLSQNCVLKNVDPELMGQLEQCLEISDLKKSTVFLRQGARQMEQFFVLGGITKRVVSSPDAIEVILRFAKEGDIETSYAAWRQKMPAPYSIICVTPARIARMPIKQWVKFMQEHKLLGERFELEVMRIMSGVMDHITSLHLHDAPSRSSHFFQAHQDLSNLLPQKEIAMYLNLCPETLSRLRAKQATPLPDTVLE